MHGTCVRGLIEGAHRQYNLSDFIVPFVSGPGRSGLAAALLEPLGRTADTAPANPPSCTG